MTDAGCGACEVLEDTYTVEYKGELGSFCLWQVVVEDESAGDWIQVDVIIGYDWVEDNYYIEVKLSYQAMSCAAGHRDGEMTWEHTRSTPYVCDNMTIEITSGESNDSCRPANCTVYYPAS